jgi:hypothetical protein
MDVMEKDGSVVWAVMATFPARSESVQRAVRMLANQVDVIVVVFNEYTEVPAWCSEIPNLRPVVPDKDRKDVSKFLPVVPDDAWVFLVDDDLKYPADYVAHSLASIEALGAPPHTIFGYHGTIYGWFVAAGFAKALVRHVLSFARHRSFHRAAYRRVLRFDRALPSAWKVEQLGTGTVVARGRDLMRLADAEGSERRVDTRLASWAQRTGRSMVALPRAHEWLQNTVQEETIYDTYTSHRPQEFLDEVSLFSGKVKGLGPVRG